MEDIGTPRGSSRDCMNENEETQEQVDEEVQALTPATPIVSVSGHCVSRRSRMAINFHDCSNNSSSSCTSSGGDGDPGRCCHNGGSDGDEETDCEQCSICQSPLFVYHTTSASKPNSDKKVQILPRCGHSFHIGCIRKSVEFGHRCDLQFFTKEK